MTTDVVTIDRLAELEETIGRGLRTFVDVGNALTEIRDSKLYKRDYHSFEAYLRERWGLSKPYAYQIMAAARVSAIADVPNEYQARQFARELRTQGFSRSAIAERTGLTRNAVQHVTLDIPAPAVVRGVRGPVVNTRTRATPLPAAPFAASQEWGELTHLIATLAAFGEKFSNIDAMVGAVPARRRRTTAERLRRTGSYLARLAYALEATEGDSE